MNYLTQILRINGYSEVYRRGPAFGGLLLALLLIGLTGVVHRPHQMPQLAATSPETLAAVKAKVQKLPLYFIENQGQTDAKVAYYAQGRQTSEYFTRDGLTLSLDSPPKSEPQNANNRPDHVPALPRGNADGGAFAPHDRRAVDPGSHAGAWEPEN